MESKVKANMTIYRGMRTIGGTLIAVEHGDSCIYFDMGTVFDPELNVQPTDFKLMIEKDMVTPICGLFNPKISGIKDEKPAHQNVAVFLSHVHLDHSKIINAVHPDIDIYTSIETKKLIESLNVNGEFLDVFNEVLPLDHHTRHITGIPFYDTVEVGNIRVTLIPVDHDAYGACGLKIEVDDQVIAYTGDIRLHGFAPEDSHAFCEQVKGCDLLITEGVSVSFNEVASPEEDTSMTEPKLIDAILGILSENQFKNLSFNIYPANVKRIEALIKKVSPDRTLVFTAYCANIIKQTLGIETRYYLLDEQDDYGLEPSLQCDFNDLVNDQSRFFWQLDQAAFKYINRLLEHSLYIHSDAIPLGQYDPTYAPFFEEFEKNNIETIELKCSGHAYTVDLMRIIERIKPKLLCPIHSFEPQRLFNLYGERRLPEKEETITL